MAVNINKDTVYRAAKPKHKDYMINDGGGLYLVVNITGSKLWRFVYTFDGKRKKFSLGSYPDTNLETARRKSEEAREQLSKGFDPNTIKKESKALKKIESLNEQRITQGLAIIGSFSDIAEKWLKSTEHLVSKTTQTKKISRLNRLAYPLLGNKQISDIKSSDIFDVIKPLIKRNHLETAHRIHGEISSIFAYAIVHNYTNYDPSQPVARQIPAQKVAHRAAIIDPKLFGQLLRDIQNYQGTFIVLNAFKLSPLLFQRPGEIRTMLWSDIHLDEGEWRPYVSKTNFHHIVPLSNQAIAIIEAIKPLTHKSNYVFPSSRGDGRPMSNNTISTALKTLGYSSDVMTAHGFRTTASTLLNEQGWSPDAIERQLAHAPRDNVRAAYNRAQYLEERRRMMQDWADYLDTLKKGATSVGDI